MKQYAWMRLWVSIIAMSGVMMLLGQVHVSAGEAPSLAGGIQVAQATPDEAPDLSAVTNLARTFWLYEGAYQVVDSGGGVCVGQCQVVNPLTNACACESGYTPVHAARILVDVTGATCGSFLFTCVK
jgi:hypothetical protein